MSSEKGTALASEMAGRAVRKFLLLKLAML
jgi:hypothetical protein